MEQKYVAFFAFIMIVAIIFAGAFEQVDILNTTTNINGTTITQQQALSEISSATLIQNYTIPFINLTVPFFNPQFFLNIIKFGTWDINFLQADQFGQTVRMFLIVLTILVTVATITLLVNFFTTLFKGG